MLYFLSYRAKRWKMKPDGGKAATLGEGEVYDPPPSGAKQPAGVSVRATDQGCIWKQTQG